MRQAAIYYKKEKAGILTQLDDGSFQFQYTNEWMIDPSKNSISLSLPKTQPTHKALHLFPFFYNMLPEGSNKARICQQLRLDKDDHFGLLLSTAKYDSIGAITIKKISPEQHVEHP